MSFLSPLPSASSFDKIFSYYILKASSSIFYLQRFHANSLVYHFSFFHLQLFYPILVLLPNTLLLLVVWLCCSRTSDTFLLLHLLPNPINLISTSAAQVGSASSTPILPLLQSPLISYLPIVNHLPSQFPKVIHWLINISMLYPSCVSDNPQMSCLVQPLIQSLSGLLLSLHPLPSSLLSISSSGGEQPEFPLQFPLHHHLHSPLLRHPLASHNFSPMAKLLTYFYPFQHSKHIFQLTLLSLCFNIHTRGRKQPAQDKNRAEIQGMACEACSF